MCGITGWVSFESDLLQRRSNIEDMTATMASRGPDDAGTWVGEHVALGHRRLAIIDLAGGHQPMIAHTPNGAVVLCYSGEVYNFAELRRDLVGKGHIFRTRSDTEVVLNGYLEWGEKVPERLNGMFAFAIWDERSTRLVMIRDRMGIKPLFYYPTRDGVLFGSEPKAILANPLADKTIDIDGLRGLLALRALTKAPGWSLWKGMLEVPPGAVVTVDPDGIRSREYWKLHTVEHRDDQSTTVERIRELLTDVVRRQLVADVPRCVLLSGGIDSSAITGVAAGQLAGRNEQLRTFSVGFDGYEESFKPREGCETPDSLFVRDVVDHVGSAHRNVVLDSSVLADSEVRRAVISARDIPSGNGDFDSSLYLLFKAIRSTSTVALSGESADEVFGGYPWFHDNEARRSRDFPWAAFVKSRNNNLFAWVHPALRNMVDVYGYVADQSASAVADVEHVSGASAFERQMRTVCYLHLTRLVRVLLDRKDRLSMAVGLEVRVPFCDHRLVEYVYNTPWSLKTFDGREKSLLRHASRHVIPASVMNRTKSNYPTTQDSSYIRMLQAQAKSILAERNSPVFDLVDRGWLVKAAHGDPLSAPSEIRAGVNWALDLYHWLDIYNPKVVL